MRLLFGSVLWFAANALAQSPPMPDAELVAGATPTVARAREVALFPRSIALAPDGSVYLGHSRRVWRVDADGVLSSPAGPCESVDLSIINAIAVDSRGNSFVTEWGGQSCPRTRFPAGPAA